MPLQDISKQYSGILYGLSNGLASVAASGETLHHMPAAAAAAAHLLLWVVPVLVWWWSSERLLGRDCLARGHLVVPAHVVGRAYSPPTLLTLVVTARFTTPSPSSPLPAVSIYATGQVLHYTHDWSLVFEVAAGLYAAGALAYLTWASCEEQFAPEADEQLAAVAGKSAAPPSPQGKFKAQ